MTPTQEKNTVVYGTWFRSDATVRRCRGQSGRRPSTSPPFPGEEEEEEEEKERWVSVGRTWRKGTWGNEGFDIGGRGGGRGGAMTS